MKEIITDPEKLEVAEPLKFITDTGIDREKGDQIINDLKEIMEANPDMISLPFASGIIMIRLFGYISRNRTAPWPT